MYLGRETGGGRFPVRLLSPFFAITHTSGRTAITNSTKRPPIAGLDAPVAGAHAHAADALELSTVLGTLAGRAHSTPGRERVLALAPRATLDEAQAAQQVYRDLLACVEATDPPPVASPPDLRPELDRLRREGATLRGEELWRIGLLLVQVRAMVTWHRRTRRDLPGLATLLEVLDPLESVLREITRALEPSAEVRDDATPELHHIRRSIRSHRERLATRLEGILRWLQTPESFVTLRDERYVIAVPSGNRAAVPGTILGHSASGASLFIEPREAAEGNSHLAELGVDEAREVERILRELTALAHAQAPAIERNFDAMARLDATQAVASWAREVDATLPDLTEDRELRLRSARHPILVERHRRGEIPAPVPLDLELDRETRMLLITGPNMGGKTVAMKTAGLLALLAMAGLPVPAAHGTVIAWFDRIVCDIGDEQSILSDVSTFLSHLRRVTEALGSATERSFVLLDELGSGTDPVEGAALGQAVLEALLGRGALCIATTHHGMLKTFAHDTPGVRNASMAFDESSLRPLFRLVTGVPGGSRAIQVAERYGMASSVLDRARALLPQGERDLTRLLEELSRLREEARIERAALERAQSELRAREEELDMARDRLEVERRERKQAELQARRDLLRRLEDQIEDVRKKLRTERKTSPDALREARGLARGIEEEIERESPAAAGGALPGAPADTVAPGDKVLVPTLGAEAEVLTTPDADGRVRVRIGGATAVLPLDRLRRVEPSSAGRAAPSSAGRARSVDGGSPAAPRGGASFQAETAEVKPEIDLRGLEADDAVRAAERFLEDAVMAGLPSARIIHGKGKGILRERIQRWLQSSALVKEFRLGEIREGGTGVTVVTLT